MGRIDKDEIGYRQQMIMQCIWDADGPVTVGDIIARLQEKCGQTFAGPTINTQLLSLKAKKLVEQGKKIHQSFTYHPLISREEFQARELKRVRRLSFGDSNVSVVKAMIRGGISEEDRKEIRKLLDGRK